MGSEDDSVVDIGDYVCVTGDRGVDIGKVINRKLCIHRIAGDGDFDVGSGQPHGGEET